MEDNQVRELTRAAADAIRSAHNGDIPRAAMQLGSGLNSIARAIETTTVLSFADIPGFPVPSVKGHAGKLLIGRLRGEPVICLQGRVHFYEGLGLRPVLVMIRALKALGVEILVLTNAAGGLNPELAPGSLMVIADHINFAGANPLVGANDDDAGPRFPDMTGAYDADLRILLHDAAEEAGVALEDGVYIMAAGPNFETPAEIRAFRTLGADAVGMSTVPECLAAVHCGIRVAGVSTITNLAAGLSPVPLTHEETMKEGERAAKRLVSVLAGFVKWVNAEKG